MSARTFAWWLVAMGMTVIVVLGMTGILSPAALHAGVLAVRSAAVGGVWIDADGVVAAPQVEMQRELQIAREEALDQIPADLSRQSRLRKVSLRRLEDAIRTHRTNQLLPLPEEIEFLAGLQRVQYVFVYPDQQDIVLAGPGEGWKIDALGNVVGFSSGLPVLLLDDLMSALRTAQVAAQSGLSCSIDPTAEGIQRVEAVTKGFKNVVDPAATAAKIEEALGPQVVTLTGVPPTSHFGRVMVAADFRMKRLAMNFDRSPVADMPSYLHLMQAVRRGTPNMLPRWWLAPHYDPLLTDPDRLAWEIRGQGVKCMTEQDLVREDGSRERTGKVGAAAQKWADNMTAHYEELAAKDSAFGQLRNIMDLAVVAALIEKEGLLDRAGSSLPYLLREEMLMQYNPPKRVNSQASVLQKGRYWVFSASGGVQIYPRDVANQTEVSDSLAPVRAQSVAGGQNWWWD